MSTSAIARLARISPLWWIVLACVIYGGWRLYQFYDLFANFCETTVHRTIPSPDRRHVAVVFDIDCGATTDFNTQVSVMPSTKSFSPKAYPSSFFVDGRHDLAIRWLASNSLEIGVPACERISRQDAAQAGVVITYRRAVGDGPAGCWPYPANAGDH